MEAKDGTIGSDFAGTYTNIKTHKLIEYSFGDRIAWVEFTDVSQGIRTRLTFDSAPLSIPSSRVATILDNFPLCRSWSVTCFADHQGARYEGKTYPPKVIISLATSTDGVPPKWATQ